ncbi:hypothetical protein MTP99_019470 [Tenebrio molitor]|nr:hypothetical protein MTP99_019470 [Tenebrio molitor]
MASNRKIVLNDISLLDHHIQCIIRSGLLLDDDLAYVRVCYDSRFYYCNDKRFPFYQQWAGAISLTSSLLIVQKKCPISYIPLCAAPVIIVGVKHLVESLCRRKRRKNMEMLIESISDNTKLNRMIYKYFQYRKDASEITATQINPYTKRIEDFIHNIFLQEIYVFENFKMCMSLLDAYVPDLKDRYIYLEDEFFEHLRVFDVKNINDCVIYMQKLENIYMLITSHCLTCLAVTLCPDKWNEYNYNVDEILDIIVIKMKDISRDCYIKTKKMFDDVKYYKLSRTELKTECKLPLPRPDTDSKLNVSVAKTIMHTSEILKNCQVILTKLQKGDMQPAEKEQLIDCIGVLCREVYNFHESLDGLHELYEIKTHRSKPLVQVEQELRNDTSLVLESACDKKVVNPNANEPNIKDEEYERYVAASEVPPTATSSTTHYEEEQEKRRLAFLLSQELKQKLKTGSRDVPPTAASSTTHYEEEQERRRLAFLLSQELKHKLKTGSRFVAERKNRGITDEKPETDIEKATIGEEPQTSETERGFINNEPGISEVKNEPGISDVKNEPGTSGIKKPKILASPPPPLPPVNLGPQGDGVQLPPGNAILDALLKDALKNRYTVEGGFKLAGEAEEQASDK